MKTILIILIIGALALTAKAQTQPVLPENHPGFPADNTDVDSQEKNDPKPVVQRPLNDTTKYHQADVLPEYPGGIENLKNYFKKNLKYPKDALKDNIQGEVQVSFVVERDGTLTGIKIIKGLTPDANTEALRLIAAMPKWIPGKYAARAVRVQYSIPVNFRTNN